jgi:phosphoribosyl 1,2-cyclic phosphate phosphodiesterase
MLQIELLFLGTGTSLGVPMIGCHCPVCSSTDPHDKRLRPSMLISYDGFRVLIDTTPELRMQCITHGIDMIDAVVFTHAHADHVMGLDDVRRFNFMSGKPLDVWADPPTQQSLQRCFGYAFRGPNPQEKLIRPHLIMRNINGPFMIGPMTWHPVPLIHGASHVLGFRIGRLAYCTDVSGIPEESFALLEGLDTLVLGALSPHKHPSHFSLEEAVAAARRIGAKETWFTHIGHAVSHAAINPTLPPTIQLAYDGLRIGARETGA